MAIWRARRPARGPGLLIFSEMWGVARVEDARWPTTMRPRAGARSRPTCSGARSSPASCRSPRPTRPGGGSTRSTGSAQRTMPAPRQLGCADQPQCTGKIAAIGFCMGGRISFLAGARAGVDAAISLYALGIAKHLDELRTVTCPTQLHYGLSDEHIPLPEIDAVAQPRATTAMSRCTAMPAPATAFSPRAALLQRAGRGAGQRPHRRAARNIEIEVVAPDSASS